MAGQMPCSEPFFNQQTRKDIEECCCAVQQMWNSVEIGMPKSHGILTLGCHHNTRSLSSHALPAADAQSSCANHNCKGNWHIPKHNPHLLNADCLLCNSELLSRIEQFICKVAELR
jgi:hypothetical protein